MRRLKIFDEKGACFIPLLNGWSRTWETRGEDETDGDKLEKNAFYIFLESIFLHFEGKKSVEVQKRYFVHRTIVNYLYLYNMFRDFRRSTISFILLCLTLTLGAQCKAQQQTPIVDRMEIPLPLSSKSEQLLYRKSYTVSYNREYKIPNWVAWHLTAKHTTGQIPRPNNAWHEDVQVPEPRAMVSDYKGSGWSRGHMCPAGDNKWDSDAMYESFLLTNCCPQNANLNSGDWNQIEMSCRRWAEQYGDIYIVCGPILFNKEHETIGPNKIVVPEAFFKVVLCLNGKPKGIGFIRRNTDSNRRKDLYINSIKEVERITGITFFPLLPKEVADSVKSKADLNDWQ